MQEFSTGDGFREVTNFIFEAKNDRLQSDAEVLTSLGYKIMDRLFSDSSVNAIETFQAAGGTAPYRFVAAIRNSSVLDYVAFRSYFDLLEFMRRYLPVLEKLNILAASAIPWQKAMRRHPVCEEMFHQ